MLLLCCSDVLMILMNAGLVCLRGWSLRLPVANHLLSKVPDDRVHVVHGGMSILVEKQWNECDYFIEKWIILSK
jgi:hypothetical protein